MTEITITVLQDDIDHAISAIYSADQEYCISSDNCACHEVASRLTKAVEDASKRR